MNEFKEQNVRITGMHCAACEILIERAWQDLPGVKKVKVRRAAQCASIVADRHISLDELRQAVKADGYDVEPMTTTKPHTIIRSAADRWTEIGAIIILFGVIYLIARGFGLMPSNIGVYEGMSYGFIFVLGLVAAFSSCMSVTGGLLLSVIATYRELYPEITGKQLLRPHILFNVGRLLSYAVFGGLIGLIGSALTPNPLVLAIITIIASCIMLLLGFQLLGIFPALQRFRLQLPKNWIHTIYNHSHKGFSASGPLWFGAATFFFPCGFTQAMQLYVLSQGDWWQGSMTMLVFALGTSPALISIAAITSWLKGLWLHYIQMVAGVLVIILALSSILNGLSLSGLLSLSQNSNTTETNVTTERGVQVASMKVNGLDYEPAQFVVKAGVPVEWRIDGSEAAGCARILIARSLGVQEILPSDSIKTIRFIPEKPGTIAFSCSMGMTTPGAKFTVIN